MRWEARARKTEIEQTKRKTVKTTSKLKKLNYYRLTVATIMGVCIATSAATALGLACHGIGRNAATLALFTGTLAAILTWRTLVQFQLSCWASGGKFSQPK
jgi:hypothetical protein